MFSIFLILKSHAPRQKSSGVTLLPPPTQKVPTSNTEGGWSCSLAEYIRHNDMPIHEAADKALKTFQEEFMPVETFSEFLDVAGECGDPLRLGSLI